MGLHHRKGRAATACVGMLAAAVACSSEKPPGQLSSSLPPPSVAVSPTVTADPTTARSTTPTPTRKPLTIAVAGDIHFEGVLRERLDNPASALSPAAATLAAADLSIVNLETSVGTGGRPDPGKRYTFQAPPTAFTALAAAGIDVATMANNHALDFGRSPLPSTFDAIGVAREANPSLAVVGIGRDADHAFRPARINVGGTIVAIIGATVADADPTADPTGQWAATEDTPGTADAINPVRLFHAVADADRSAGVVVVYMHWGIQGERCPSDAQRSLAADLVEAGADIVVGSHTHELQGDGRIGEGYVAYGLGNYAWYTQSPAATSVTGVLTLTVQPDPSQNGRATVTGTQWKPARIRADGLPTPMTGSAAADFDAHLAGLRACAGLARNR